MRCCRPAMRHSSERHLLADDPLWYKDAIIYELHVARLLRQQRRRHRRFSRPDRRSSITCRTSASPPSGCCHSIPRRCATTATTSPTTTRRPSRTTARLRDFQAFLRAAHERGLRVITELVINHTSDQHPWFQRARRASPAVAERDFYVWSDTPEKYQRRAHHLQGLRAVELDLGPGRQGLLLAPLLCPSARSELRQPGGARGRASRCSISGWRWASTACGSTRFPTCIEREGTNCENLAGDARVPEAAPAAHRRAISRTACSWPRRTSGRRTCGRTSATATSATWRSTSRSCRGCSWRCSWRIASRSSTSCGRRRPIPENCQWAMFLRNHDELTLEMVTDEERDYMYRVYAADPQMRHQSRHPPPPRAAARATTGARSSC